MARSIHKAAIVGLALAWGALASASTEASRKVYAEAYAAIEADDCPKAVPLLRRYLELEKAALEKMPEEKRRLETQIEACRAKVTIRANPM